MRDLRSGGALRLGTRAEWAFTDSLSANVGIDWARYALAEADTKNIANDIDDDDDEDDDDDDEDGEGYTLGGLELKYLTVSAGLTWRF